MKNLLKGLLCYILTIFVIILGFSLFSSFMIGELSFTKIIIGGVGFMITLRPAYNEWFDRFKKLFKFED